MVGHCADEICRIFGVRLAEWRDRQYCFCNSLHVVIAGCLHVYNTSDIERLLDVRRQLYPCITYKPVHPWQHLIERNTVFAVLLRGVEEIVSSLDKHFCMRSPFEGSRFHSLGEQFQELCLGCFEVCNVKPHNVDISSSYCKFGRGIAPIGLNVLHKHRGLVWLCRLWDWYYGIVYSVYSICTRCGREAAGKDGGHHP